MIYHINFLAALSLCIQGFLFHFSDGPKMTTISQAAKSCDLYLSTFMKPLCAPQCLIKCNFLIHLALSKAKRISRATVQFPEIDKLIGICTHEGLDG